MVAARLGAGNRRLCAGRAHRHRWCRGAAGAHRNGDLHRDLDRDRGAINDRAAAADVDNHRATDDPAAGPDRATNDPPADHDTDPATHR